MAHAASGPRGLCIPERPRRIGPPPGRCPEYRRSRSLDLPPFVGLLPCFTSAMPDRFEKRLENGPPVVTDGGMGVLVSSAVPGLRCPEEANIRAPESVVSLHTSFINAGAELIETNTFGANRHTLRSHFLGTDAQALNGRGR